MSVTQSQLSLFQRIVQTVHAWHDVAIQPVNHHEQHNKQHELLAVVSKGVPCNKPSQRQMTVSYYGT